MPIHRDQFEFLTCTIVADTPATYSGLRRHLIEKSSPAVLGPRAIILTGTHGFADTGEDGLINLKCLNSSKQRISRWNGVKSETRYFYVEWCEKFFVDHAEGEDPREVNEVTGEVSAIKKDITAPCWKIRSKKIRDVEIDFKVLVVIV